MVGCFDRTILGALDTMHATPIADSCERVWRANGWSRSTAQRWHRKHRLTYFPSITYESLGLVHEHHILPRPEPLSFMVESAWIRSPDGRRWFYAHCIRPKEYPRRGVVTRDPWQENAGLTRHVDARGRLTNTPALPARTPPLVVPADELVRAYPLVVPVSLECFGDRRTTDDIWHRITRRCGARLRSLFPRNTRVWQHNGKQHVRHALALLTRWGLVRQHLIRYDALRSHLAEVLIITADQDSAKRALLREVYPGDGILVMRAVGDVHLLKDACNGASWYLIEEHLPVSGAGYESWGDA